MRYSTLTTFFVLSLMSATVLVADVVVKYRVYADLITAPSRLSNGHACPATVELPQTGDVVTLTWSADKARLDRPGISVVLRADEGRLYLMFHGVRKVASLQYPVPYEKYRLPFEKAMGADLTHYRIVSIAGPEQVKYLDRNATRYSAVVVNGLRNQWRASFVLTTELPSDPSRALAMRAVLHELRFGGDSWLDILPLNGRLPLQWEEAEHQPETEALYREEATEIEQRTLPPDAYAVPREYIKIDYDPNCMRTR